VQRNYRFRPAAVAQSGAAGFNPLSLFTTYSAAGLYIPNFNNFNLLFQDSAGTVPVTAAADPIGKVVDFGPTGTLMTQATAGSRGTLRLVGTDYVWRGDGVAMCLNSNLSPGSSTTYVFGVKFALTSSLDAISGSRTGTTTTRSILLSDASGKLAGGVANQDQTTITGGSDIRGTPGVAALRYNGTNVQLWWRAAGGALTTLYGPSAQSGTPNTTIPLYIGAQNVNNAAAGVIPLDGDIYSGFIIKAALSDADVALLIGTMPPY